jgi:RNA polymerase sigma-70 factor (ECF subfamily)
MDETPTDDRLAKLAAQDADAFATLYRRHLQRVYSYLLSRTGNIQDAQDLTAQTFMAAMENITNYEPRGLFVGWLMSIAKRKLIDHWRCQQPIISIEAADTQTDGKQIPDDIVRERLQMQEITVVLSKLNPERAEVLTLRFFGELKIREVAAVMGKSEGAVKMLLARALDDLRNILVVQEETS